jgi:hypothetical protein
VIFDDLLYDINHTSLEKGHGQGFWRSDGRGFFLPTAAIIRYVVFDFFG